MSVVPGRNGHVPVHRHRGLDEAPPGARRRVRRRSSPTTGGSSARHSARRAGARSTPRATRSSTRSQRAREAVAAAVAGQRALAAHEWPGGVEVQGADGTAHRRAGGRRRGLRRARRRPGGADLLGRPRRAGAALGDDPRARRRRPAARASRSATSASRSSRTSAPSTSTSSSSAARRPTSRCCARRGRAADFGERITRHVESMVEAQLNSVFAGGKPPTAKLAGLTAFGI